MRVGHRYSLGNVFLAMSRGVFSLDPDTLWTLAYFLHHFVNGVLEAMFLRRSKCTGPFTLNIIAMFNDTVSPSICRISKRLITQSTWVTFTL